MASSRSIGNPFPDRGWSWTLGLIVILLPGLSSLSCKHRYPAPAYDISKQAQSRHGMVVTAHPWATEVGLKVLKAGGNAVDAAVAVQFTLAVVYPEAGNIGGGGFMVLYRPGDGAHALDFREKAPLSAKEDMYLDAAGNVRPKASTLGHLAAGVPGAVDGMVQAHTRYGRLNWEFLLEDAIRLARDGFILTEKAAAGLNARAADFREANTRPTALVRSSGWKPGDRLVQKQLAATLERIAREGRKGFYEGETARMLLEEMQRGGGWISQQDLDAYTSVWREPVQGTYRGYDVFSMPPPSSGGLALLQLLELLEAGSADVHQQPQSTYMHTLAEAERRVYADRAYYLGDPDFVEVPVQGLLDDRYLASRWLDFRRDTVTPSSNIRAGEVPFRESEQTTHFSIIDKEGLAVSVTTTLNSDFGSKVVVGGAGFLLNNEMDDFSVKPGVPNQFGLVGAKANAIAPGKRMLSSMTPTILCKDGKPALIVGSPGGATIITSVLQVIMNVVDRGYALADAVAAPRFHHQWKPDTLWVEQGFPDSVLHRLRSLGHQVVSRPPIGRVDAIWVSPDGSLHGAADPRGDDHAAGY